MPEESESRNPCAEPPSLAAVRLQLQRLASSPQLHSSVSLVRFLTFIVEEALEGRAGRLKEYIIGVEVFQRGAAFDPRIDPIVRVQARKLRDRLAEYYSSAGACDTIGIELPKGGYAPIVRLRNARPPSPPKPPAPPSRPSIPLVYPAILAVLAAGIWLAVTNLHRGPRQQTMDLAQITFDNGSAHPAVSRDGNWLVYESDQGARDSDIWVKPLNGGAPSRLSSHPSADTTPDISPGGALVAFRSNRGGGGIFIVPLTGGEERRIAGNGYSPRFSPDGAYIAFASKDDIGVVPASGGEARYLNAGIPAASFPLWSEDGKHLLFLGRDASGRFDWWTAPFDPRAPRKPEATRTGLAALLTRRNLPQLLEYTAPSDWYENGVLTSLNGSLWLIPISTRTWKVDGDPRQILPGPGVEFARAIRARSSARLVFAVRAANVHIFSLTPATPNSPSPRLTQLTHDVSLKGGFEGARPALSPDGNILLYPSSVSGNLDIWKQDLRGGRVRPLASTPLPEDRPIFRRDGSAVAYGVTDGPHHSIHIVGIDGANHRRVCSGCGRLNDLSPDGKALLVTAAPRESLFLVTPENGERKALLNDPRLTVMEASFSPNGGYLAIAYMKQGETGVQASLAPFNNGVLADESQWINIARESFFASLHFSEDGRTVYFFSTRDNNRCLWAQPVPSAGRPPEDPYVVSHFHTARHYPLNGGWLAVGKDRIVMTLSDVISDVWSAAPRIPTHN